MKETTSHKSLKTAATTLTLIGVALAGLGTLGCDELPGAFGVAAGGKLDASSKMTVLCDQRVKTDIAPIDDALATLSKVRVKSFRYNDQLRASHPEIANRAYYNVIAQEFAQVFPDYVKPSGEKLADGSDMLCVDPSPLLAYSVAGIQELMGQVEAQRKQIADLTEQLQHLRAQTTRAPTSNQSSVRRLE